MTVCTARGCKSTKIKAKGLCSKHYMQAYYRKRKSTASSKAPVVRLVADKGKDAKRGPGRPKKDIEAGSLEERKLMAQIRELDLKNEEKAGSLLRADEVKEEWLSHLAALRTGLEAAPGWLKTHSPDPMTPGQMATVREWIDVFVNDIGVDLSS